MDVIGYVVYYQGTYGTQKFAPIVSRSPVEQSWPKTVQQMIIERPEATICIEPVDKIPNWHHA